MLHRGAETAGQGEPLARSSLSFALPPPHRRRAWRGLR